MEQYGYNTEVFKNIFMVNDEDLPETSQYKWRYPFAHWYILSSVNKDAMKIWANSIDEDNIEDHLSINADGQLTITINGTTTVADCPSLKTFALIFNEYADCHIAFTKESFLERFSNDLYTFYKEFEQTTKAIDDLMNLTDNDIAIADRMITNIANIPEVTSSTDVEEVDYVSQQQKSINKKGTLQIKKEQLSNKRSYTVRSFLNKFRHLFIKIISPSYVSVYEEEEGE